MYPISPSFAQYLQNPNSIVIAKVDINDKTYTDVHIVDFSIENSLTQGDDLELGTVTLSRLVLNLRTKDDLPPNAKVVPYIGLDYSLLPWQEADFPWQDADFSWTGVAGDWLPMGEFYIDNRTKVKDVLQVECFDKLVWANAPYLSGLTYPATMRAVWDEICQQLDYVYDNSVVINSGFMVPVAPVGYSIRQVMGFIASANAACVYAGKDGRIKFKRFAATEQPVINITGSDYTSVKQTNPLRTFTRVVVTYDDEDDLSFEAGEGSDATTLFITNPLATQQMTDHIYAAINGVSYLPITMDAIGFPQIEPGDLIGYGVYDGTAWIDADIPWTDYHVPWDGISHYQSYLLRVSFGYKGGIKMSAESPARSDQQSEFMVEGELEGQIKRLTQSAVRQGKLYYGLTISKEAGLQIDRSDGKARAVFNADELTFYKGTDKALWFDVDNERYKFSGTIEAGEVIGTKITGGTINGTNISGSTITGNTINGGSINGTTISGAAIYGGVISGPLIQTGSSFPRIEMNSSGNLLTASLNNSESIAISPNLSGSPTILWNSGGSIAGLLTYTQGYGTWIRSMKENILVSAAKRIDLSPGGGFNINIPSWSRFYNETNGRTLQQEINDIYAAIAAMGS